MSARTSFFAYCLFALLINVVPIISTPFLYLSTIFHELSHGVAALLTGGRIQEFALQLNGAGHLVSLGGIQFIITFSGYFGAPIWGALLYLSADSRSVAKFTLGVLIAMFLITLLLWVNSLITLFILLLVGMLLVALIKSSRYQSFNHVMRIMAMVVVFNAIYSPTYLLYSSRGDSLALAQLTFIPAIVWVGVWMVWGLYVLFRLYPTNSQENHE